MSKFLEILKTIWAYIVKIVLFIVNLCKKFVNLIIKAVKTPAITLAILGIYFFVAHVFNFTFGSKVDLLIYTFNMIIALLGAKLLSEK